MSRILCFGELLLRLTAPTGTLLSQADRLAVHVGGAEGNVAVGLASLGHRTAMVSRVPDNALGAAALGHLRRHGVDVSAVSTAPGRMGLYFLEPGAGVRPPEIVYDREGSSFALAGPEDFDWDRLLEGAALLHLSGITPALGPRSAALAAAAAAAAAAKGVPLSFDGNYRAQLWQRWDADPAALLRPIVERAEILFGNERDVALLLGASFADRGEAAAAAFAAFPRLQLIASTTRHIEDSGTHCLSARIDARDAVAQAPEVRVSGIIDRIGTGDAFAAGVLHGHLEKLGLESAVQTGLALAVLKHGLAGDASLFGPGDVAAYLAGGADVRR